MPEHYTRNTLEVTAWCEKCQRFTQHRVDGGRRGPCLEHKAQEYTLEQFKRMANEKKRQLQAEFDRQNPRLF